MRQFGTRLGIAFQIKDDLFDYQVVNRSGKPSGIDIKEQKMTLPLIHALAQSKASQRRKIIRTIKKDHRDPKKVAEVVDFVNASGGIAYAEEAMKRYRDEAIELLMHFEEAPVRNALEALVHYVIERKK